MFKVMDQKFLKKCTMDGSFLKKCRSIGGIGAGLSAIGMMLIAIGLIALVMGGASSSKTGESSMFIGSAIVCLVLAVIGIPLLLLGNSLSKKKLRTYLSYYSKKSGYTEEQLTGLDQEAVSPDTMYYIAQGKLQSNSAPLCSLITKNWLVMPFMFIRAVDTAAIFFEKEPYYKGGKRDDSLFILHTNGSLYFHSCKEDISTFIIEQIKKRNHAAIVVRRFKVQDQVFDCMQQPEEVAKLYASYGK